MGCRPPLEIRVWWHHKQRSPVLAGWAGGPCCALDIGVGVVHGTDLAPSPLPLFGGDGAELGLALCASSAVASHFPLAMWLWPWVGVSVGLGLTVAPKPYWGPVMAVGTASHL